MSQEVLLRLASLVFRISLLLLVITGSFALVFSGPDAIKKAVQDSKIYSASAAIAQAQAINIEIAPAIKPALEDAASAVFTPSYLQSVSDQFIDGTYHWLDGTSPKPDFNIDATAAVDQFMTIVSDETTKYAQQLPPCKSANLQAAELSTSDLLALKCLPPGNTPEMIRSETVARLRDSNELLKNPVINAESLSNASKGQTFYDKSVDVPMKFQVAKLLPWIFILVCVAAVFVIFKVYRDSPGKAVYSLAKSFLWVGLPLLLVSGLGHLAFSALTQPSGSITQSVNGTFQQYGIAFARSLESTFAQTLLVMAAVITVAGAAAMIYVRMQLKPANDIGIPPAEYPRAAPSQKTRLTVRPAAPVGSTVKPTRAPEQPTAVIMPATPAERAEPTETAKPADQASQDEQQK